MSAVQKITIKFFRDLAELDNLSDSEINHINRLWIRFIDDNYRNITVPDVGPVSGSTMFVSVRFSNNTLERNAVKSILELVDANIAE